MLCPTVLGSIEKEEKQKGKGSLRSRWNRDGQESVGILSFSLWAEHHCTLEGGGVCHRETWWHRWGAWWHRSGAWWSEHWIRVHETRCNNQKSRVSKEWNTTSLFVFSLEMWGRPDCLASLIVINRIFNGCSHFLRKTHAVKGLETLTCMWIFRSGVPHSPLIFYLFFSFLAYSWSAMLCYFQVYGKVIQLYIHLLFFKLFSHRAHYRGLSSAHCAMHTVGSC